MNAMCIFLCLFATIQLFMLIICFGRLFNSTEFSLTPYIFLCLPRFPAVKIPFNPYLHNPLCCLCFSPYVNLPTLAFWLSVHLPLHYLLYMLPVPFYRCIAIVVADGITAVAAVTLASAPASASVVIIVDYEDNDNHNTVLNFLTRQAYLISSSLNIFSYTDHSRRFSLFHHIIYMHERARLIVYASQNAFCTYPSIHSSIDKYICFKTQTSKSVVSQLTR